MTETTALVSTAEQGGRAEAVAVYSKRGNYVIQVGTDRNSQMTLKRDVDFGLISGTKRPSLYKSGAEKVVIAYRLFKRYTIESKIEQVDEHGPLFYFLVRCDLIRVANNGVEYVVSNGHGSANTREKRNGFAAPWDTANTAIKMAEKRSLVAAAISLAGISDIFAQDMENADYVEAGMQALADRAKDDNRLSQKELQQLYAVAGQRGLSVPQAQQILKAAGYASVKDIKKDDFDSVLELMRGDKA